jgi:hypothetical protein
MPAGTRKELATAFGEQQTGEVVREGSVPVYRTLLTLDGRFIEIPDEFCRLIGHRREELLGKPVEVVSAPRTASAPKHLRSVFQFGDFEGLDVYGQGGTTDSDAMRVGAFGRYVDRNSCGAYSAAAKETISAIKLTVRAEGFISKST